MANALLRDPRLRDVVWRNLIHPTRRQTAHELLLVTPWLIGSLLCARHGLWLLAPLLSFAFFLTGLRVVHNAYHRALGLPGWADDATIFTLSVLMGWPLHAVKVNHLRHHRLCLGPGDVEAASARMPALAAIAVGPLFPPLLLAAGLRHGSRTDRAWITAESLALCTLLAAAWTLPLPWLRYHVAAMLTGECLTAFFAVWTVHHGCEEDGILARTQDSWIKNALTWHMFLHVEHHLFPAVPTCNLPILSRRIAEVAPDLRIKQVF
ncbi:MAG: fatty acid desaturase [Myxococcota bacterium]|jgi:fatty acid desaturase